jgi:hypothetical protein
MAALRALDAEVVTSPGQPVCRRRKPWFHAPLFLFWPGVIPRNMLFLLIVLLHGFRRLLPPY